MARSEYWNCPLRLPAPAADQVAIASGVSQSVTSLRCTRARSYSAQFSTPYLVLYFGCTSTSRRDHAVSTATMARTAPVDPRIDVSAHQRPEPALRSRTAHSSIESPLLGQRKHHLRVRLCVGRRLDRVLACITGVAIVVVARAECIAPGFLDSGVTVFASTRPRPARRGRVVPERGFGSCTSLASTARCTSA